MITVEFQHQNNHFPPFLEYAVTPMIEVLTLLMFQLFHIY